MEKFILRLSSHESNMCKMLCTLMESQILVDLTINCKSYSLKIHKCVLAAKSEYFREKLQKDLTIDRILINGIKPSVLKSLITFIYCGGTSVAAEDMHDLISAAAYFRIPGIMSILKDKFKIDLSRKPELNLDETPPLFFSNNIKGNTSKNNYNTMPISVLSAKCNAPEKSKEARYLLAKEQAASQLTIKVLRENKAKLALTDENCTEVTVEAELAPDFGDSEPLQEFILENLDKNRVKQTAPVDSFNRHINEVFVLQPDNDRVLHDLPAGHTVSYQLIPQNKGDIEIQEYICNTINDYAVNSTSNVCYDIIPEKKIQMTFAEISSAAVSDTYNSNVETVTVLENCNVHAASDRYITNEETPRLIANYNSNVENHTVDEEYKFNVETSAVNTDYSSSETENNTCDPNVETVTKIENDTSNEGTETIPETINSTTNIIGYNSNAATNSTDENHNSLTLLKYSQNSSSSELKQKLDIIPVSSIEEVLVSKSYDEKSIYETNGRCSVMEKILPNYDMKYNDNAVAYSDVVNAENKKLHKRKCGDILSINSTRKNVHFKDENNIENVDPDMPKPRKYSKLCDEYEMTTVKSLRNNYSSFTVIRPQNMENVVRSNILLTKNGIDSEKCIYDDTKETNSFDAKPTSLNQSTSSPNSFLYLDNRKEDDIFKSKENRRQTRSSTKRFTM